MEFWPADFRADAATSAKKRRKGKEVYRLKEQSIEPGSLGAATLTLGQAPPQWITLVRPSSKNISLVTGKSVEVFPPTKPPLSNVPRLTIHQRAEQGTRFLRTYHPDIDVSFELIKEELQSDEEEAAADYTLDPYAGNGLAPISLETNRNQLTRFLAFASGVTGSELNISPFRVTEDKREIFSPSSTPVSTFDTPIRQLDTFSPKEATPQKFSLLAVRTHATVSVVKLQSSPDDHTEGPAVVSRAVTPISVSDTGGRRVVDLSCGLFSSSSAQVLLVNDMGALYNCRIKGGSKTLIVAPDVEASEHSELDHFWRVARRDANTCMRASGKKVHQFDLRARTAIPRELFHLADAREYLTSIEAWSNESHTTCFATTSKLLWFDERNLKYPVLSFKHQRAFDRSLRVGSISKGQSVLTTLSSPTNRLVTVYDVNYASSGHIQLYDGPSLFSGLPILDLPITGSLFLRHADEGTPEFSHFQLSSRGSLWKTSIGFSDVQDAAPNLEDFEWSENMQAFAKRVRAMPEDIGALGGREYFDANLRGIYEKIFDVQGDTSEPVEEDAEAVYQTLEKMPFFWQDMNGSTDHTLTTFDITFQSGSEPLHASRADFLTESLLSSRRGFAALAWGRIPIPRLLSTARWHYDISSMPPAMTPNLSTQSQSLMDQLRGEALKHAVTPEGMKRASEATQHLVLDLALSRHAYAPQFFRMKGTYVGSELDGPDVLSQATKAMSLGITEPPPVQFGYLHPVPRHPHEEGMESGDDSNDVGQEMPLGVCLLMSQWEVGSNPDEYIYKDPYEEQDAPLTTGKPAAMQKGTGVAMDVPESSQYASMPPVINVPRPPTVVSSTSRRVLTGQSQPAARMTSVLETYPFAGSSPARHPPSLFSGNVEQSGNSQEVHGSDIHTCSQEILGPSTQPLPGQFGGGYRQGGRKKVIKKRMGGF